MRKVIECSITWSRGEDSGQVSLGREKEAVVIYFRYIEHSLTFHSLRRSNEKSK